MPIIGVLMLLAMFLIFLGMFCSLLGEEWLDGLDDERTRE